MQSITKNAAAPKDTRLMLIRLYEALVIEVESSVDCMDPQVWLEHYSLLEEYEEIYGKDAKRDSN